MKKGSNHQALREVTLPRLPEAFEDPRPVLVTGIVAWAVAALFFGFTRGWDSELVITSLIGMVTGILGFGVYAWQRFAVSRGAQWVQDGISVESASEHTSPNAPHSISSIDGTSPANTIPGGTHTSGSAGSSPSDAPQASNPTEVGVAHPSVSTPTTDGNALPSQDESR